MKKDLKVVSYWTSEDEDGHSTWVEGAEPDGWDTFEPGYLGY